MIQLNTPTKLPGSVMAYKLITSLLFPVVLIVLLIIMGFAGNTVSTANQTTSSLNGIWNPVVIYGIIALFAILNVIYNLLYVSLFSFVVEQEKITITSGVLFRESKTTEYRTIQDISSKTGPLLMIFGLANLQGFTSSPDQIVITHTKSGTRTTYRPDINLLLTKSDAQALQSQIAQAAQAEAVRIVQPTATITS